MLKTVAVCTVVVGALAVAGQSQKPAPTAPSKTARNEAEICQRIIDDGSVYTQSLKSQCIADLQEAGWNTCTAPCIVVLPKGTKNTKDAWTSNYGFDEHRSGVAIVSVWHK